MSTRLKTLLLDKAFIHLKDKRILDCNFSNFFVSYRHNESKFHVQVFNTQDINKTPKEQANFHIDRDSFIENVLEKSSLQENQAKEHAKKIVIDFSSPNIAKPFHAGHLRSTVIGNFIANINKYFNNHVTKLNYLGDWGTQFGVLQYGLQQNKINLDKIKIDPIRKLYEVYVEANKLSLIDDNVKIQARRYFSDIEQGKTNLDNWKHIRQLTVEELERIYQRLGIHFDDYHWESDYNGAAIKNLMESLERKGVIKRDDTGKKIAEVNNKDVTILKSDNSTLYLSRDIAALLDRYSRYNFDKMIYVVDNAQTDHFAALFEIVKKINVDCANRCEHVKFGRIKGMSSRTGNVVFLNDILDEAKRKMFDKQKLSKNSRTSAMNEETCDILGTTAVIINDLKQRRQKDYVFEWDKALQSEGDSGIKLQYLHCRLWSLEKNCGVSLPETCNPKLLPEQVVGDVIADIARFDNILIRAHQENEACILVNYLFRLAKHVNRMFSDLKVKNVETDIGAQRLLVFHTVRLVVKVSLEILGTKPLYEM